QGIYYYFRTKEEMKEEPFIEQTVYNDNIYGLTVKEVEHSLSKHRAVHVSLDQNGVSAMQAAFPAQTRIIYVDVPEEKVIERIKKRGNSQEKIQERLAFGRDSGEYLPPEGTHLIVQNNDLDATVDSILETFHLLPNGIRK